MTILILMTYVEVPKKQQREMVGSLNQIALRDSLILTTMHQSFKHHWRVIESLPIVIRSMLCLRIRSHIRNLERLLVYRAF